MQVSRFTTGGFVIHAITHLSRAKISAWFDAKGALLDAHYPDLGRDVAPTSPVRTSLSTLGRAWAQPTA